MIYPYRRRRAAVLLMALALIFLLITQANRLTGVTASHPIAKAAGLPPDNTDLLILQGSTGTPSDSGFAKVGQFYGLKRRNVNIASTTVTDALLRDEAGAYIPSIMIDGANLTSTYLNSTELQVLSNAITNGGVNLYVAALRGANNATLQTLTGGEITGSAAVTDSQKDYIISRALPDVTRELSGITITHNSAQLDYALGIAAGATHTQVIVNSTDDSRQTYAMFARYKGGLGSVFVASNYTDTYLQYNTLADNYAATATRNSFSQQRFAQLMPIMMFERYSGGNEAWHRNHDYANFTIDDPHLSQTDLDFSGILQQVIAHNYHLTIAFIPGYAQTYQQAVVDLFTQNPDRLSLVQHGNNHDGYEFYKYTVGPNDPYPARPYPDQEADIVEGKARLQTFSQTTGLPYGQVMIFPFNISPAATLTLLKKYNFQATINSQDYPLDMSRAWSTTAYMYPAEMEYSDFAVIKRYGPESEAYPLDMFIGKPVFLYDHPPFYSGNASAFNSIADSINGIQGDVQWRSLDYILKHMDMEKTDDDGSIEVMFYGNDIIATNETDTDKVYHLTKQETLNVPILGVTLDATPATYSVANGTFLADTLIPAHSSRELVITYDSSSPATATPTPSATQATAPTASSTSTPSSTPTSTASPTATSTSTATALATSTPSSTALPTDTPTVTPTYTPTGTPTITPSNTAVPSATPTDSPTQTWTPTDTPSETPSYTSTSTPTGTPAVGTTSTPTNTATSTPTDTPISSATTTDTPTVTDTPASTLTPTYTATNTPVPTDTATHTPTDTSTASPSRTSTSTYTPTDTPTDTPLATSTSSATASSTPTVSPTASSTTAATATDTDTPTMTASSTASPVPSDTPATTPTSASTYTPTDTPTPSPSPTLTSTFTPTDTLTATPTSTPTNSPTYTATTTPSSTATATSSPLPATPTLTPAATSTPTATQTAVPVQRIFSDGFETGDLSQWTGGSGLVVQSQEVFSGAFAARGTSTGSPAYEYKRLAVAQSDIYYRVRLKSITQGSRWIYPMRFLTAGGGQVLAVYLASGSSAKIGVQNYVANVSATSATVLSRGTWHELQVHVKVAGAQSLVEVWLDGLQLTDLTRTDTLGTTAVGRLQLGENATGSPFDIVFDDVTIDNVFIVGPAVMRAPDTRLVEVPARRDNLGEMCYNSDCPDGYWPRDAYMRQSGGVVAVRT